MKFLCDRCKTRYSIGDDRVRGKILKIRCKNCANVITVREGMVEAESDASGPNADRQRAGRPTTMAPPATVAVAQPTTGNSGDALRAAFAGSQSTSPAALEEEWYVSIDGEQFGPFGLADAQRWVATKPFDADVHCWSEGFDDWLGIDKVSHFRGLRRQSQATSPPTRTRSAPQLPSQVQRAESEPKPLFAATMASIEKGLAADQAAVAAKTNGSATPAMSGPAAATKSKKKGKGKAKTPAAGTRTNAMPAPTPAATPAAGTPLVPGTNDDDDPPDSHTTVEAPPFADDIATRAEPVATKGIFDRFDAASESRSESSRGSSPDPSLAPSASRAPSPPERVLSKLDEADPEDDGLDIGEVSRVVNLADLARTAPKRTSSRAPMVMRATGATPKIDMTPAPGAMGGLAPAGMPLDAEAELVASPVVAIGHRRGLIILIGVAAVLLIGVIGAVVLILTSGNNSDLPMGLGHSSEIDTSRPEDLAHPKNPGDPGPGATAVIHTPLVRRWPSGPQIHQGNTPEVPSDPTGMALKAEDIEDMANKQSGGTQRCYMRAQKGVMGIDINDLKKISVTLTVGKDGSVTDVALSDHSGDQLGTCLSGQIKRWRFRQSPGGTYRIVLAFAAS